MILAPFLHNSLEQKQEEIETKNIEIVQQKSVIPTAEISKDISKKATEPLGSARDSIFSIKKILEQEEKKEELQISNPKENFPDSHFSETDLQKEWLNFLQNLAIHNPVAFNAINTFKLLKIAENQIEVCYSSEIAKKEFEEIEGDFFNGFRYKVNNFKIEVVYKYNSALKKEFLTKRKIFDKFVEINPVLKDLESLMKFDFS